MENDKEAILNNGIVSLIYEEKEHRFSLDATNKEKLKEMIKEGKQPRGRLMT